MGSFRHPRLVTSPFPPMPNVSIVTADRSFSIICLFGSRPSSIEQHARTLHVPDGLRTRLFELRSTLALVQRDLDRIAASAATSDETAGS